MVKCRGLLTLQELLASQSHGHLEVHLVVCQPSTCTRGIPPIIDVAKQNVGRTEQCTDGGPCQMEEASVRETMKPCTASFALRACTLPEDGTVILGHQSLLSDHFPKMASEVLL